MARRSKLTSPFSADAKRARDEADGVEDRGDAKKAKVDVPEARAPSPKHGREDGEDGGEDAGGSAIKRARVEDKAAAMVAEKAKTAQSEGKKAAEGDGVEAG
jgi:hypothetical protein